MQREIAALKPDVSRKPRRRSTMRGPRSRRCRRWSKTSPATSPGSTLTARPRRPSSIGSVRSSASSARGHPWRPKYFSRKGAHVTYQHGTHPRQRDARDAVRSRWRAQCSSRSPRSCTNGRRRRRPGGRQGHAADPRLRDVVIDLIATAVAHAASMGFFMRKDDTDGQAQD